MTKKTERTVKLRWHFKRAIMPFMLAFALVLTAIAPANVTAESVTPGSKKVLHETRKGGDEDLSSYTKIYTIADLVDINNNPDGNYILMNDIDITEETKEGGSWDTGHGWTPLKEFSGILDGNGYRIKGMHIYGDSCNYAGLFSINYGTIRRLGLSGVNINTNAKYAGGITAYSSYSGTISECYVDGVINNQGDYTGGIAGYLGSGKISNCYNTAKVSGNGILGVSYYDDIYSCYNIGEVERYPISDSSSRGYIYALKGKSLDRYATMLTEAQMRTQSVYVGFDFEKVWEIDPYSSYPYPQLKSNRQHRIDGFDIVTPPSKTNYSQGEKIDLSGGTVNIIYEDGYSTTVAITEDMLQEYDTSLIGEQTIFIEYGGKKTSFTITVKSIDVTSVEITGDGNSMAKGSSMQLKAVLKPDNVTDAMVQWSSSNNEVATVDEKGMVKALSTGSAEITATAINGVVGQYSIDVAVPCVSINLNSTEVTVYKDASFELVSTLSPVDATDKVSYKVANPGIAIVNDSGKITGRAAGETKVTASAGGKTATCNVTVKRKLEDFRIEGVIDKEYTGSKVEQKIKVTDGSTVLDEDKDYKVSYTDNDKTGTATVLVTGLGYYEGSIEKDFKISEESTGKTPASSAAPSRTPAPSKSPAASTAPGKSPAASTAPSKSPAASAAPSKSPAASAAPSKSPAASAAPSKSPAVSAAPSKIPAASAAPSVTVPTKAPADSPDMSDMDIGFWDEDKNTDSSIYDTELPVPEIKEVSNNNNKVSISWSCSDTSDIDGYNIYRSKNGKNWNKIATINDAETEDYDDKDISSDGGYGYTICSYAGDTESELSTPEYTYYLSKVSIKSAKSKTVKKLTVKWSKNKKASGYQVRISTTKSFKNTTTDVKKTDSKNKSTKTIGKLKGGKKYFVQVRAYRLYNDEVYYSAWSSSKSVKVKK